MGNRHKLGDLQLAIMRVLWAHGEAPASQVHAELLEERGLAVTTIKTMLRKMEDRGIVEHHARGRQFIYRPAVAEADVRDGMVSGLVDRLFLGNSAALVNHLIDSGDIDPEELDELRDRLAEKRGEGA